MVGTNTESKLQVVPIIRFFIIRILVFLLLTSYFAWKGLFVDYYFQMMAFISLELDERIILFNFKVLDAAVSIMIAPNGLWINMIREDCIRFLIYMWAFKNCGTSSTQVTPRTLVVSSFLISCWVVLSRFIYWWI